MSLPDMYRSILALKDPARVKKFKAAWAKVIKDIGGQAAAEKTYAKLKTFCTTNMWPLIKQIQDAVKKLKASGKKQPTPKDLVYSTLAQAMTQKNLADLLAATKNR
ncbi:hypothetical protein AAVH_42493 [Aphelenchoides avenae]|nr:hypothetical protein AAVH_42493 [Aphelenchus avenae]